MSLFSFLCHYGIYYHLWLKYFDVWLSKFCSLVFSWYTITKLRLALKLKSIFVFYSWCCMHVVFYPCQTLGNRRSVLFMVLYRISQYLFKDKGGIKKLLIAGKSFCLSSEHNVSCCLCINYNHHVRNWSKAAWVTLHTACGHLFC